MNLSFEDNNQNDGEQKDEQITKDQVNKTILEFQLFTHKMLNKTERK